MDSGFKVWLPTLNVIEPEIMYKPEQKAIVWRRNGIINEAII